MFGQFNDFHFLELNDSRVPDIDDCDGEMFRHYSPEALELHNFSDKCNVWSFGNECYNMNFHFTGLQYICNMCVYTYTGVLAWELFSYGAIPYSDQEVKNEEQLLKLLLSGFMLERPRGMYVCIASLMCQYAPLNQCHLYVCTSTPIACPELIYNTIISACWRKDKLSRPRFEWLKMKLDEELSALRFRTNVLSEEMRQGGERAAMLKSPIRK